ncbi:hypothetical protein SCFA_340005 [anaerobic digester metagenome]|uniref:Uncharacterized protein n=1 Tax=anaerobic digester metagenome TaxID=1263854 RepID=A0A485M3W7_9ZZZZ
MKIIAYFLKVPANSCHKTKSGTKYRRHLVKDVRLGILQVVRFEPAKCFKA